MTVQESQCCQVASETNKSWDKSLCSVDMHHLEASDSRVDIYEWQTGLQHLCSCHVGDKRDVLLHSLSWKQWGHPARRQDIRELTKRTSTTALDVLGCQSETQASCIIVKNSWPDSLTKYLLYYPGHACLNTQNKHKSNNASVTSLHSYNKNTMMYSMNGTGTCLSLSAPSRSLRCWISQCLCNQ